MTSTSKKIEQRQGLKFFITASFLLVHVVAVAGSLGLPDSARPGAIRPQAEIPPELSAHSADAVDIPAVIDRPFDIEEGPYVKVRKFRLLDVEDFPKSDMGIEEINTTILSKLLQEQPEKGFSIGELQEAADLVTSYYRGKGFILSTAIIPVQTVAEGIVDIQVFVGRLGRVLIESNENYKAEILIKPFNKLIGQPITQQNIEAALLALTDYPGLSIFGVFQPGRKTGEADILLKVQEEKWYAVAFRADNHGSQETGRNRFRTVVDWNNPTGFADRITATYQQSYNPKNNNYWSLDYKRFLGEGFSLGFGAFKNRFDVGGEFASNDISAETANNSIYLEKSFIRSRQENLGMTLSLKQKVSTTTASSSQISRDRLTVLDLELNYDSADTFHPLRPLYKFFYKDLPDNYGGGLNFVTLNYARGFNNILGAMGSSAEQAAGAVNSQSSRRGNQGGEFAEGQFSKVFGSYQRIQLLTHNQSLLFRTEFQWSKDILTSLEQYSVGGPENVRGFPDAQGLFERAFFFSFEYIFNAPFIANKPAFKNRTWGELLQFSVFYDFATAQQNDAIENTNDKNTSGSWITFKSVGMGLRFNLPGEINARLMYATELGPDIPSDGRFGHIWGDFTYSF